MFKISKETLDIEDAIRHPHTVAVKFLRLKKSCCVLMSDVGKRLSIHELVNMQLSP